MFNPVREGKEVTISGCKITINEMTIGDIKRLWAELGNMESMDAFLRKNWNDFIVGIEIDECDALTPGELKQIYAAFREVNAVFFDLAAKSAAADPGLKEMQAAIMNDLIAQFAALPKEAIPESGTTDTDSSPQP